MSKNYHLHSTNLVELRAQEYEEFLREKAVRAREESLKEMEAKRREDATRKKEEQKREKALKEEATREKWGKLLVERSHVRPITAPNTATSGLKQQAEPKKMSVEELDRKWRKQKKLVELRTTPTTTINPTTTAPLEIRSNSTLEHG